MEPCALRWWVLENGVVSGSSAPSPFTNGGGISGAVNFVWEILRFKWAENSHTKTRGFRNIDRSECDLAQPPPPPPVRGILSSTGVLLLPKGQPLRTASLRFTGGPRR